MSVSWFSDHEELEFDSIYQCIKAEQSWNAQAKPDDVLTLFTQLVQQGLEAVQPIRETHQKLEHLVDCFYTHWGFSGSYHTREPSQLNSVYQTLRYRTGSNLSLAIILSALLQRLGFDAALSLQQHNIMVQVTISDVESYTIEPLSGSQQWYLVPENDATEQEEPPEIILDEEIYKLYLANQKWAFIGSEKFDAAFACVELLMELLGDDPYERRDRGYLLSQINCTEMAKEDLTYFINECPDDPSNEFVRHQLAELGHNHHTLH